MAETDSILDNQEVTAQILNDIAIDLGHTSFNGFGENKFGADELNGITGDLVSPGILSSDNKCEPYISDEKVYINTGTIVFANGSKKKITEIMELDLITNSYIYALNDTAHNVCKIVVSETAPTEDDFVNLCEIAADGTLTDKRVIAKAKVELPTEGNSFSFTENYLKGTNINSVKEKTITIPIKGVSKIIIIAMGVAVGELDIKSQSFSGIYLKDTKFASYNSASSCPIYCKEGSPNQTISIVIDSVSENFIVLKHYFVTNLSTVYENLTVNFYVFGGVEK